MLADDVTSPQGGIFAPATGSHAYVELDATRGMPFGSVGNHGRMFVGFSRAQTPLRRMLESMAGALDGTPDALTRYTKPTTGAYYFIPSAESLLTLSAPS